MGSIRNRQAQGPFKTSGTEMLPAKMCQWIASLLLSAWASSATTASADVPDTQSKEGKETTLDTAEEPVDTFPICQPEGGRILGGFGPPRVCDLSGGPRDFHDGGGLCSPGRWPRERRNLADSDGWSWLRHKLFEQAARRAGIVEELESEVFRVAVGGEEGVGCQGPALHQGVGRYAGKLGRSPGLGCPGPDRCG